MADTLSFRAARLGASCALLSCLSIGPASAAVPKKPGTPLDQKAFALPDLHISMANVPLADVMDKLPNRAAWERFAARRAAAGAPLNVFIDPRSGAATNIVDVGPLIPGSGVGNHVTLESLSQLLGRPVTTVDAAVVADVTVVYVRANAALLGILPEELGNLGPEPNQPNTVRGTCADGPQGVSPLDGSADGIKVFTIDQSKFAAGSTVAITATFRARANFTEDAADLFYAANATNPSWVFLGTMVPTASGSQTYTKKYVLPQGSLQAVRVQLRHNGSNVPCAGGPEDDRDDLVFAVGL